jgi:hypothetical protein
MTYYKHNKKTNPTYQVIGAGEMKYNGQWFPCVIYKDIKTLKIYVREEQSFDESFKIINNE